jgi:Prealbumin-like fold domain
MTNRRTSAVMKRIHRSFSRRTLKWLTVTVAALAFAAVALPSFANLPGSTFEGNDGNLVVNTAGNTDWANAPNRVVGVDQPSGSSDNAFGQGTKEDDPNVKVVTGSIPPNKNDLTRFYIGSEFAGGSNFLYLAWERLVNIGNANLDLEINQNSTAGFTGTTTGPVTLNRTAGDLLVTYDFGGSGTPTLGLLKWLTTANGDSVSDCFSSNTLPCWGKHVNLSAAGDAEGAVNTATVTDPVPPNAPRTLTTGLFGEAAINLTAAGVFPAGTCEAFGSTFLKSRASSSFGAEVKDFIAPQPVNISNCGRIVIKKRTDPRGINQNFSFTSTIPNPPGGSNSPSCTSDSTPSSFTLNDNGNTTSDSAANTEDCSNVVAGSYTVTEGAEPANFTLESLTCTATGGGSGTQDGTNPFKANITVVPGSVVTCVYVDQASGAILVTKTAKNHSLGSGDHPLAGATFTVNGVSKVTDANGNACFDGLAVGTAYTVTETSAPNGYAIDTTSKSVTPSSAASCSSGTPDGVSFTDSPLTDIVAKATSEVAGVTNSTITCKDSSNANVGNSPKGPSDPAEVDANGLKPGIYTCTIDIDP